MFKCFVGALAQYYELYYSIIYLGTANKIYRILLRVKYLDHEHLYRKARCSVDTSTTVDNLIPTDVVQ